MWFLIVGVVLLVLKLADIGPVAQWSLIWVLLPFVLAVLWWAFADRTGLTQRRAMNKMDEKKRARRDRDMKALGLDVRRDRRIRVLRESRGPHESPPAPPPAEPPRRDPRP
jgi:small Trp-rich protein